MRKGLKNSLFSPHVSKTGAARACAWKQRFPVSSGLVRLSVREFFYIEILLGKRNLDLVFIEFLVDLLV